MERNEKAALSSWIPRVDLTRDPETLKQGSKQWKRTAQEMKEALERHGYFLVKYDAISDDDRARLHGAMNSMFNLPDETKEGGWGGGGGCKPGEFYPRYVCRSSLLPLYETVVVGDAAQKETFEAFTRRMWPSGNDDFCNALQTVGGEMAALARELMGMILDVYGLGTHVEAITEATDAAGRSYAWAKPRAEKIPGSALADAVYKLMKYSAPAKEIKALGLPAHADSSCLTVIGQNDVPGLTIKNEQGEWVEVDPSRGYFVVLAGQSLRALTNGRLHAPLHQVNVSGVEDRLSYSLFLCPKPDQMVEALPEMVDAEHPRLFEPHAYRELAAAVSETVMHVSHLARAPDS